MNSPSPNTDKLVSNVISLLLLIIFVITLVSSIFVHVYVLSQAFNAKPLGQLYQLVVTISNTSPILSLLVKTI